MSAVEELRRIAKSAQGAADRRSKKADSGPRSSELHHAAAVHQEAAARAHEAVAQHPDTPVGHREAWQAKADVHRAKAELHAAKADLGSAGDQARDELGRFAEK